ncbi:4Fe-4S binding protein [candidate division KSB1 bacterium]
MIKFDISKCTGCKRCETACAFYRTGKINNRMSRIKVLNIYETGIDGPVFCTNCLEQYCARCPNDAVTVGVYGQIIVSPTMCDLCGACEKNCPIGAFELFEDFAYVCDLCGGRPKCVEACTEGAIIYEESDTRISLEDIKKITKKMNPSEKRDYYIKKLGADLRKKWRAANA